MPKFSELEKVSVVSTDSYPDYFLVNIADSEDEGATFHTKQISFDNVKNEMLDEINNTISGTLVKMDLSGDAGLYYDDSEQGNTSISIDSLINDSSADLLVRRGLNELDLIDITGSFASGTASIPYSVIKDAPEIPEPIDTTDIVRFISASIAYGPFFYENTEGDPVGIPLASFFTKVLVENNIIDEGTGKIPYTAIESGASLATQETVTQLQEQLQSELEYNVIYDSNGNALVSGSDTILSLSNVVTYSQGALSTTSGIVLSDSDITNIESIPELKDKLPSDPNDSLLIYASGAITGGDLTIHDPNNLVVLSDNAFMTVSGDTIDLPFAEILISNSSDFTRLTSPDQQNVTIPRYITTPDGVFDTFENQIVNNA